MALNQGVFGGYATPAAAASAEGRLANVTGMVPTNFKKFRKAVANVRAGVADAVCINIGDSTGVGYGAGLTQATAPMNLLAQHLNSTMLPTSYDTVWGSIAGGTGIADSRVVLGTGWSGGSASGWNSGGWTATTSASGSLDYTPTLSCDTLTLYYDRNTTFGTCVVMMDGVTTLGTLNMAGAASQQSVTYTFTAGVHTFNIMPPTVGSVFIVGFYPKLSTQKRLHFSTAAKGGTKAVDWIDAGTFLAPLNQWDLVQPDLTIGELGINDGGASTAPSLYKARMQTIITKARLYGDYLHVTSVPSSIQPYLTYEPLYAAVDLALQATNGTGVVDMAGRWVSYADANAYGLYSSGDGLHPSNLGYHDKAAFLAAALRLVI